jgi:D-alanyl-D-alanine dipeptidase
MVHYLVILYGFGFFMLFSCVQDNGSASTRDNSTNDAKRVNINEKQFEIRQTKDDSLKTFTSLVDVRQLNPTIKVDLKYATDDNFMGMRLYEKIDRAYLQKDVAQRLAKVQETLSKKKPGFCLLIYDALRPVSVQRRMWEALDSIPPIQRGKFVSNPDKRSLHNMGAAVDITIVDKLGIPLDMGAGFDDMREIAYPSMEHYYLKTGELSIQQYENRLLLRKLMQSQGFRQLETEWWHFNACSRSKALETYNVLLEEF